MCRLHTIWTLIHFTKLHEPSCSQFLAHHFLPSSLPPPLLSFGCIVCVWMRVNGLSRPRILLHLARERTSEQTVKRETKTHKFRFVSIYSCKLLSTFLFLTLFAVVLQRGFHVFTFQYTFTVRPKSNKKKTLTSKLALKIE